MDLAFAVAEGAPRDPVVADWTARMYDAHGAIHHVDVAFGSTLFRVYAPGEGVSRSR